MVHAWKINPSIYHLLRRLHDNSQERTPVECSPEIPEPAACGGCTFKRCLQLVTMIILTGLHCFVGSTMRIICFIAW